MVALGACGRDGDEPEKAPARKPAPPAKRPAIWAKLRAPGEGQTLAVHKGAARVMPISEARASGLLDVDLGDGWAPFIFSETDPDRGTDAGPPVSKPNAYRKTFLDLANDRVDPEEVFLAGGPTRALDLAEEEAEKNGRDKQDKDRAKEKEDRARVRKRTEPVRNHLEVFGIPPTLSVLLRRLEDDARKVCFDDVDVEGLKGLPATVTYQSNRAARREFDEAAADAAWLAARQVDAGPGDAGAPSPQDAARLARQQRGQARVRAIKAAQARLACEGLLTTRSKYLPGMFDLPTHQALAEWERKNDIFGWGFLGEETLVALQRPPLELHFETWKRILTERLADAAGVIEDGTAPGSAQAARQLQGRRRKAPSGAQPAGRPPGRVAGAAGAEHARGDGRLPACHGLLRAAPPARGVHRAAVAAVLRAASISISESVHGPGGGDRSRRHLVRLSLRRVGQAARAAARALPPPDGAGALEGPAHSPGPLAHHHRVVAQRAGGGRARLLQVQELRHRAAHLEAGGGGAGLGPARQHAGPGPADQEGVRPAGGSRSTW